MMLLGWVLHHCGHALAHVRGGTAMVDQRLGTSVSTE
jgi:hypothetical protein